MIFRAVLTIGLVALLWPHEPDVGLGRPGLLSALGVQGTAALQTEGEALSFRDDLLVRLQQVKSDLRAAQAEIAETGTAETGIMVGEKRGVAVNTSGRPTVSDLIVESLARR